MYTWLNK